METFNTDATIKNLDGEIVPARQALCAVLPTVIFGLEALKVIIKKGLVLKICLGIVIKGLQGFQSVLCPKQVEVIENEY
jgi:hypothetical protein